MVLCSFVPPVTILLSLGTTSITCMTIILFASITKFDITRYLFIICIAGLVVTIFGIGVLITSFFVHLKILHIVYSALACLLFMIYLAVDIQMIMGGRRFEISPEEYIFAAVLLFTDIFHIFLTILSLFNANN
ncbi:hypothetical protein DICVIV_05227 [Dictyocaulus viviparus]|uniref:Uncharacterized protein n=1 Tax=Dictyocaulus viviparus TaxID=29172 RepID=A0A0D8XVJ8_DICVI|nr:hypothetical protein DICVIV_05227 [Dictyocaulus viviparus]